MVQIADPDRVSPRPAANRQVIVTRRADGIPQPDLFQVVVSPAPECPPDGVLVQVLFASVDPAMRGWLSPGRNYMSVADGDVMKAHGVGRVLESRLADWAPGDTVFGWFGWQQIAAVRAEQLIWKVDLDLAPAEAWLSVLGLNGLTAWVGFQHLAQPKAGETILVSTCAGGVGGVVGQLAQASNLRAVGLTSSAEKVALAERELGYAAAIDYVAASDLAGAVVQACPDGVDIFFDNTAGEIADAVFPALNVGARVIQCGSAAIPAWTPPPRGPRRERDMITKRLTWRGMVILDHADLFADALTDLKALYAQGRLTARHEILNGLEAAPGALRHLFSGANTGRLLLKP
jgi:NADPH-dependent curcumin reductase CurA